jgi:hypothetical protein
MRDQPITAWCSCRIERIIITPEPEGFPIADKGSMLNFMSISSSKNFTFHLCN